MIYQMSKKLLLWCIACTLSLYLLSAPARAAGTDSAGSKIQGTVIESMDSGGYTYVQLDTGRKTIWAAGPRTAINTGSMVTISSYMPMTNFHSKTLDRDFELIYFAPALITDREKTQDAIHDPHSTIRQTSNGPVPGIRKADGGVTIAEIMKDRQALQGQPVVVRGKVIKYTAEVLGRNWIHIADSSSEQDLTVTTGATAGIGDVILVSGILALDRNFGYGYSYEVIVENAEIVVE